MKSEHSEYIPSQPLAPARAVAQPRINSWAWLGYLAIALAALLPRTLDLGAFLNADEAMFWVQRSDTFLRAIRSGDWAATAISTHPGVTTMWLGSAGIILRDALYDSGVVRDGGFATFLALTRLPLSLAHSAAILLGYALLRRLLSAGPAFLAALLWATDPFVIGFSRVLHVDGLAGTFATLSLLAACLYWHHDPRWRWLILSGATGGLAILSKSPALALLPVVGLVALAAAFRPPTTNHRPPTTQDRGSKIEDRNARAAEAPSSILDPRSSILALLAWAVIVAATIFALWPALWVGPLRAYAQVQLGIEAEGAGTHVSGNFFMGQDIDQPGALFYPVALALRSTPWALLGLLGLPLALRNAQPAARCDLAALAGFVIFFVAALSLFPNKLNRYLIPAFPTVDILAAIGLTAIFDLRFPILDLRLNQSKIQNLKSKIMLGVVSLIALINAAWYHPYGIAYFNQALGGARAGASTFLYGTGEGMEQVAAWLNGQPDITGVVAVSPMVQTLQPYLRRGARAINPSDGRLPNKSGYVVVYGRQTQREALLPPFDQFYGKGVPLHVVRIHGVDYAWIYQAPPAVAQPRPAAFGPAIRLRGFDQAGAPERGQPLTFRLTWEVPAAPAADYTLFAHLLAPDGRRVAQVDLPLPSSSWAPGRYQATELPIVIPPDAPPGPYRLAIGLYEPPSGPRLPLTAVATLDPAIDGPDALLLTEFEVK
ncbi:MAG TPA: glycosyltransferase family 39 protein [Roseiflexaceae bacterium]|nr:glycosyltransferase family 39 protein [Roseiflexaceae bacterium]